MTDTAPLRILMSAQAAAQTAPGLAAALGRRTHVMVQPGDDADLAFLSRIPKLLRSRLLCFFATHD